VTGAGPGTEYPGGIVYVARHLAAGEPAVGGEVLDGYPLLETVAEFQVGPTAGAFARGPDYGDPHTWAREEGAAFLRERESMRPLSKASCDCKKSNAPLIAAYVRNGHPWFWVRAQRFPAPIRDEVLERRHGADKAWPGHVEASGRPHADLATCRQCGRHWLVLIDESRFKLIRTGPPVYGARVVAE
jgi:hypothetical protein